MNRTGQLRAEWCFCPGLWFENLRAGRLKMAVFNTMFPTMRGTMNMFYLSMEDNWQ